MCIKIDLSKAFDSLNRQFLYDAMSGLGFDNRWVEWIKECMNSTFSLLINGELTNAFSSTSGVRQGDRISPYLFVLAMQVLSSLLSRAELRGEIDSMCYGSLLVSHIIFVDDLMVFLKADKKNA